MVKCRGIVWRCMEKNKQNYVNIIILKKEELKEIIKQNKKGNNVITNENLK